MIKKLNITKDGLFKELDISYTSYLRAKEKDSKSAMNIIKKLNKYFKITELDYSKQDEYEKVLNGILFNFYYKGNNINEYEEILLKYIEENNYLKPLFWLLLLLVKSGQYKPLQVVLKENIGLYNELIVYKELYSTSPFLEIYLIMYICYSGDEYVELDKTVVFSENMKGLVYNAYCTNAYLSKKYDLCLYYAIQCKEQLLKDYNYNRLMNVNLTYFSCLNNLGEYSKCFDEAKRQLLYLTQTNQNIKLIYSTEIHYYTACLGLKDYDEVINSIINKSNITISDYIYLLVASSHNKKEFNKYLEKYEADSIRFNKNQNGDINAIVGYLSGENKSLFKEKMLKCKINIGLKNILLKFY